jgi:hypothetical protein
MAGLPGQKNSRHSPAREAIGRTIWRKPLTELGLTPHASSAFQPPAFSCSKSSSDSTHRAASVRQKFSLRVRQRLTRRNSAEPATFEHFPI